MDTALKQRLWGAAVLAALAIIFLPMLLRSPDVKTPDAAQVPLTLPAAPDGKFETRELPLVEPETSTPPGGVLGMPEAGANPEADSAGIAAATTVPSPAAAMQPAGAAVPAASAPSTTPAPAKVDASAATKPPATPVPAAPPKPAPATPVAATPAATAVATSAGAAAGGYAVTIGSFTNLANANALVSRLRAAKLPVLTDKVTVSGGTAMRVRVGPFADRTAAEAARLRANSVSGGSGQVVALDAVAASPAPAATTATTKPAGDKALAAAPPKPAAPVPASTPTASGFAVQLAAPASQADANALRDRARAQGLAAFVQRVDTDRGTLYRVRLGPVADRSAAETLRATAQQKLGITGNIVSHP